MSAATRDRIETDDSAQSQAKRGRATPAGSFCLYVCIIILSSLVIANPLVLRFFFAISPTRDIYIVFFDAIALLVIFFAARYFRRRNKRDFVATLVVLLAWPLAMVGAERMILSRHEAFQRFAAAPRKPVQGESVHQRDPLLGWVPRPGARARHVSKGNFDVIYTIDASGRKDIPANPGAKRTIHFFGDSITFGHGVSNEQTALNLLAKALGRQANVANYGVMAYGLEQMYLRLRSTKSNIKPGDVVIFSPVSLDLKRNLIAKDFVCFLYDKNYSAVETFPWREATQWRAERLSDQCPEGDLPLAYLERFFIAKRSDSMDAALAENADEIFAMAKAIAAERGAKFEVIFLVYPDECRTKVFDFDINLLKTEYITMMPYCLDEEVMANMRFKTDRHLNAAGNEWAARSLLDIIESNNLIENYPMSPGPAPRNSARKGQVSCAEKGRSGTRYERAVCASLRQGEESIDRKQRSR